MDGVRGLNLGPQLGVKPQAPGQERTPNVGLEAEPRGTGLAARTPGAGPEVELHVKLGGAPAPPSSCANELM